MTRILDRPARFVVIAFALLFFATGCTGLLGGPEGRAGNALDATSEAVVQHNRLYGEARDSYDEARKALDAGEDPKGQVERIKNARQDLLEARGSLEKARKSLSDVGNLGVAREIKDYADLLSGAMGDQLEAEAREAEFYQVLEKDPILERDREKALDLLSRAGDGYKRAEDAYGRARKLAEANPDLLRES